MQATEELSLVEQDVISTNKQFVEECLLSWVPLEEWKSFLQKLVYEETHYTMQLAAKQMLREHFNETEGGFKILPEAKPVEVMYPVEWSMV